jgi:hypothetical protein
MMVVDLPALAPRPRPVPLRLAYTVLVLMVFFAVPGLVAWALGRIGGGPSGDSMVPIVVLFVLGALAAGRVSYRWFDAFLVLIPIYGLFFLVKLAWRLALLPYRDWPPRPEEAPHWRKVAHPSRPGAGLYLVDPARQP